MATLKRSIHTLEEFNSLTTKELCDWLTENVPEIDVTNIMINKEVGRGFSSVLRAENGTSVIKKLMDYFDIPKGHARAIFECFIPIISNPTQPALSVGLAQLPVNQVLLPQPVVPTPVIALPQPVVANQPAAVSPQETIVEPSVSSSDDITSVDKPKEKKKIGLSKKEKVTVVLKFVNQILVNFGLKQLNNLTELINFELHVIAKHEKNVKYFNEVQKELCEALEIAVCSDNFVSFLNKICQIIGYRLAHTIKYIDNRSLSLYTINISGKCQCPKCYRTFVSDHAVKIHRAVNVTCQEN